MGTEQDIREILARGVTRKGVAVANTVDEPSRALWVALQIRQLQRLCHEMLLHWVELALFDPPAHLKDASQASLAECCVELACRELGFSPNQPLSDLTARLAAQIGSRRSPLLAGGSVDPFGVMNQLVKLRKDTQGFERVPGVALGGLAITAIEGAVHAEEGLFERAFRVGGDFLVHVAYPY